MEQSSRLDSFDQKSTTWINNFVVATTTRAILPLQLTTLETISDETSNAIKAALV